MVMDFFTPAVRDVMDIRQAAEYLGISSDMLYKYAADGFIPAFKLGNRWRFRRARLEEWMKEREGNSAKEKTETSIAEG